MRIKTAVLATASVIGIFSAAPAAQAETITFDLRAAAVEAIDESSAFQLTAGGVTASLQAIVLGGDGVLNRTDSGFGVNAAASGDATDQIDGVNGGESVRITFSQDVVLTGLGLSLYSTATQVPPGDSATLLVAGTPVPIAPTSSAQDVYAFSPGYAVAQGQAVTLGWAGGNGFSFDNFIVQRATVVPLPAAAWGGVALLGGLGAARRLRRRPAGADQA